MNHEIITIELNGVNCYLVKVVEGFVLVDTAGHLLMDKEFTDRREELISKLNDKGCCSGKLKAVILTHGDCDHVANAAMIRDQYHTVIAMHSDDVELVDNVKLEHMMETFQYRTILFKIVFKLMKSKIQKIAERTLEDLKQFKPDILLKDGDTLEQFGLDAKVVHIPGHTPGSIALLFGNGDCISGDIYANIKKPELAPNAMNLKEMKESVKKLNKMKLSTIYPGHGAPFKAELLGISNR